MTALDELEGFALEMAAEAARHTLPLFRTDCAHDDKGAGTGRYDPVTEADRAAEAAMRALVARRFPDHGVVGEEYGEDRPDAEFVWVLDPIDGTRAYMAGLPVWTTLIALRRAGRPVLGVIAQPWLGEIFVGTQAGARLLTRDGATRPLAVRPARALSEAVIATTDPGLFSAEELAAWNRVRTAARFARYGCDAYAFAMVALGRIDLVIEAGLKPWDIEPAIPLLEGAGGCVTDWRGEPIGPRAGQAIIAGDPRCRDEAVGLLAPAVRA